MKRELFEYYDERAPEYEEFYMGKAAHTISNPVFYQNDTAAISKLLPDYINGKCLDIACGTGFWLPVYEKNCTEIMLIDQSEGVLAECVKKIQRLGIENKAEIIRGEIFSYSYKEHEYDSAFIGFLMSHLHDDEINNIFQILQRALKTGGRFAIIDSAWSKEIAAVRSDKAGMIKRALRDRREFEIYEIF